MVWAWMHWPMDALVAWTLSWFGHGCTGQWMPWQHGRYHGLGMDALANGCLGSMDVIMVWAWMHWPMDALVAWTLSWFGHGCTGQWMPWQHGRYHGLGMDALANGCLGSMDVIMVWAWMHWPMDALVAWTLSWFGHGCTGQWMGWQHGCVGQWMPWQLGHVQSLCAWPCVPVFSGSRFRGPGCEASPAARKRGQLPSRTKTGYALKPCTGLVASTEDVTRSL